MPKASEKRIKSACSPCHRRKRKCDGLDPCNTCDRDGYKCYYPCRPSSSGGRAEGSGFDLDNGSSSKTPSAVESKGNKRSLLSSLPDVPEAPEAAALPRPADQRSVMANSGLLFVRHLLKKIDPTHAATAQQLSAWNVGPRASQAQPQAQVEEPSQSAASITALLSQAQMVALAKVYFEKIDPCYGFIDQEAINQHIRSRWLLPPRSSCSFDAVLCGIAALGSYFSKAHAVSVEYQLVQLAKSILASIGLLKAPDQETVAAWVCHVIYMRLTAAPAAAWIASCTAMHILEAAGMHQDHHKDDSVLSQSSAGKLSKMPWRVFGVAQHLNTWISYDLGLSRVNLRGPPVQSTSSGSQNYTDKLLQLLPASLGLDRVSTENDDSLRSTLITIATKSDTEPPLIMAQCNLVLCILRQLCARNSLRSNGDLALNAALGALHKALAAARQMIEDDTPWHHLANVPFQTLCMLLAIDTPSSLSMIKDAVQTIQQVRNAYNTLNLNEACNTAYLILYLHRKRRLDDVQVMDNVLSTLMHDSDNTLPDMANGDDLEWNTNSASAMEMSWFNDLLGEFPSLQPFTASSTSNMLEDNSPSRFG